MNEKASAVSYSSSGFVALLAAINIEYLLMGLGLFVAVLTFFMNWYFKHREDRRAVAEELRKQQAHVSEQRRLNQLHSAQMKQLAKADETNI